MNAPGISDACRQCGAQMMPAMIRCRECGGRRRPSIDGPHYTPAPIAAERSSDASDRGGEHRELVPASFARRPVVDEPSLASNAADRILAAQRPRPRETNDAVQFPLQTRARRWTWRDLIPDIIYGLATDRTLAIAGAAIIAVGVVAGGLWWGPLTNADVVTPGVVIRPAEVRGFVTSLAMADDGTLAAGRTHGQVEIWDTTALQLRETLSTVRGKYVALSGNGTQLVAGDEQQSALVDRSTGEVTAQACGIRSISTNGTGTHALSPCAETGLLLWRLSSKEAPARPGLAIDNASAIALSPDGMSCAIGTRTGRVLVRDIDSAETKREVSINRSGAVTALAFDRSGERLAAITADNRLHVLNGQVYDADWGQAIRPGMTFVSKVYWINGDQILLAGGRELAICRPRETPQIWHADVQSIDSLAVSADGHLAAVGCRDESAIVLIDLTTRQRSGILDRERD